MALITCSGLVPGYDGQGVAQPMTFTVNQGDYLCIVGENGSGKSTLMKTLLHLQPPVEGQIVLGDGLVPGQIGYLPQQTNLQRDFPATVREIVLSGFQGQVGLRPFYRKEEKEQAYKNMARMGLTGMERRSYRNLSGGQQQRVLLARALCAAGKILLLDEPVAGLDPKVTAGMYQLVERLNRVEGITIIMISHDVEAALSYATHILHIGAHSFFGTKEAYLESGMARHLMLSGGSTAEEPVGTGKEKSPEKQRAAAEEPAEQKAAAAEEPAEQKAAAAEEKSAAEKTAEGKTAEGKTAEEKTAEGKTAEEKTAEGKTAQDRTAEERSADGEAARR